MKRKELIEALSLSSDIPTKAAATRIYDVLVDAIKTGLTTGDKTVALGDDIGTLVVKVNKATTKRKPGTTQVIDVPEKNVVKFKPSKALKALVL